MKYLLTIVLFFFIAVPVFAAKSVEGTLPTSSPLFTLPEGVAPNISQNVQREDPNIFPDASEEPSDNEGETILTEEKSQITNEDNSGQSNKPEENSGFGFWKIILALFIFGGLVLWYAKSKKA